MKILTRLGRRGTWSMARPLTLSIYMCVCVCVSVYFNTPYLCTQHWQINTISTRAALFVVTKLLAVARAKFETRGASSQTPATDEFKFLMQSSTASLYFANDRLSLTRTVDLNYPNCRSIDHGRVTVYRDESESASTRPRRS